MLKTDYICQPKEESTIRSEVWNAKRGSLAERQIWMQLECVSFFGETILGVRSGYRLNSEDSITCLTIHRYHR